MFHTTEVPMPVHGVHNALSARCLFSDPISVRAESIHLTNANYYSAFDKYPLGEYSSIDEYLLENTRQIFVRGRIIALKRGANIRPWNKTA